jgi:transposase-like protein
METVKTLQDAILHFSDFENCRKFMIAVRWMDGVVRCPRCESDKVTYLQKARVYKCNVKHERQKFSLKINTVFEESPIPLEKWLPALWLLVNDKNGISSYELGKALGVTQKSAWFMLHRIRVAMQSKSFVKIGHSGGPVEVDETFVGGKSINMHKSKRIALQKVRSEVRNRSGLGPYLGKTAVVGMVDRDLRQVRANVVPNVKRDTLQSEILREISPSSKVYTDEWQGYSDMHAEFVHEVVNKVKGYVDGQVHVNSVENFWSLLKRTLKGTYVAVEPYHLQAYVDEQVFRFNNRATRDNPLNDSDRFVLALKQIVGKRLTYTELTGKEGEASF